MIKKIKNWYSFKINLSMACQWWDNLDAEEKIKIYSIKGGLKQ